MSELNKGLAPTEVDYGWEVPYVVMDGVLEPLTEPDEEFERLRETISGVLHGVAAIERDFLRQYRENVCRGAKDRTAAHLALHALKGRQRKKNWKRVVRTEVERIREEMCGLAVD